MPPLTSSGHRADFWLLCLPRSLLLRFTDGSFEPCLKPTIGEARGGCEGVVGWLWGNKGLCEGRGGL